MPNQIKYCTYLIILASALFLTRCKNGNTLEDIDGNTYRTVKIGNQVWMAENLKVTKFKNGDPIPEIKDNSEWADAEGVGFCNYQNSEGKGKVYGKLYNWYALDDTRGLAPEGWHIPTSEELKELIGYLKSDTIAGAKLKEAGFGHWIRPNKGADNESGFSALPGGYRFKDGSFHTLGSNAYFWTATATFQIYSWSPRIFEGFADVDRISDYMKYGFSVRCIKDK